MQPQEERRHPRVMVNWPIGIQLPDKSIIRGRVINISIGGMGLMMDRPLQLGMQFKVAVDMSEPGNQAIRSRVVFNCRSVHSVLAKEGFRVGLEYVGEIPRAILDKWKHELTLPGQPVE
ncbi:PilZ domain-containing protein [Ampullimonas aquatilis]|uniref:PilZ domain-containing protein n=1 Tax=Ampullimonas aquatilis TaxID=1341549 RepID=UPI003C732D74